MLGNIEALSRIREQCAADKPLPAELSAWLAESLERYLRHDCPTLNEAFGVVQGHGGVPWWRERGMRERDAALRALADRHFTGMSTHQRAKAIRECAERYETVCWPRDRQLAAMPGRYRGTVQEHLWRAFRAGAKMPVSERRLRTLLGP